MFIKDKLGLDLYKISLAFESNCTLTTDGKLLLTNEQGKTSEFEFEIKPKLNPEKKSSNFGIIQPLPLRPLSTFGSVL